jgi:hypothetical protein
VIFRLNFCTIGNEKRKMKYFQHRYVLKIRIWLEIDFDPIICCNLLGRYKTTLYMKKTIIYPGFFLGRMEYQGGEVFFLVCQRICKEITKVYPLRLGPSYNGAIIIILCLWSKWGPTKKEMRICSVIVSVYTVYISGQ